ncbi:hypothetical protein [Nevskia soli]|uniref:hypothetical protein n=1 Tax=Nevskia soli TaxID=418856 RepID=UPI0015D6BA36|nr:hypothetical protein [Nevskia soli]
MTQQSFCLWALLLIPPSAYSQVTLTGAIEFATSSNGTASTCLVWNTLGGDTWGNLWLARAAALTLV